MIILHDSSQVSYQWTTGRHVTTALQDLGFPVTVVDVGDGGVLPNYTDVILLVEGLCNIADATLLTLPNHKIIYFIDSHLNMVTEDIWEAHHELYERYKVDKSMLTTFHATVLKDAKNLLGVYVAHKQYVGAYTRRVPEGAFSRHLPVAAPVLPPGQRLPDAIYDFVFLGHVNPKLHAVRQHMLSLAHALCLKNGWTLLEAKSYAPVLQTLSLGKVVLNASICGDANMRLYEALGAGRMLITDTESLRYAFDGPGFENWNGYEQALNYNVPIDPIQLESTMENALKVMNNDGAEYHGVFYHDVWEAERAFLSNVLATVEKESKMTAVITQTSQVNIHKLELHFPTAEAKAKAIEHLKTMPGGMFTGAGAPSQSPTTLEEAYRLACTTPSDINEHLHTLVSLVEEVRGYDIYPTVLELGVRTGVSTIAWLKALSEPLDKLISVDIDKSSIDYTSTKLKPLARCMFRTVCEDSRDVQEGCDILFIDTLHDGDQLLQEMLVHEDNTRVFIVLHDTSTFGEVGETGGKGLNWAVQKFLGIRNHWTVKEVFTNNNGLTILER